MKVRMDEGPKDKGPNGTNILFQLVKRVYFLMPLLQRQTQILATKVL